MFRTSIEKSAVDHTRRRIVLGGIATAALAAGGAATDIMTAVPKAATAERDSKKTLDTAFRGITHERPHGTGLRLTEQLRHGGVLDPYAAAIAERDAYAYDLTHANIRTDFRAALDRIRRSGRANDIRIAFRRAGLPADLGLALAINESFFDNKRISPAGARGVFQIQPVTAVYFAKKLGIAAKEIGTDLTYDARMAAAILADYTRQCGDDQTLGLYAYNAGPGLLGFRRTGDDMSLDSYYAYLGAKAAEHAGDTKRTRTITDHFAYAPRIDAIRDVLHTAQKKPA